AGLVSTSGSGTGEVSAGLATTTSSATGDLMGVGAETAFGGTCAAGEGAFAGAAVIMEVAERPADCAGAADGSATADGGCGCDAAVKRAMWAEICGYCCQSRLTRSHSWIASEYLCECSNL